MELRITIPKEFEEEFEFDRFKDSLGRIGFDLSEYIKLCRKCKLVALSGNKEQELADILPKIFESAELVGTAEDAFIQPPQLFEPADIDEDN